MENTQVLDDCALDVLFRRARTHRVWRDRAVPGALIRTLYDLLKYAPTASNTCPARFVFITSDAARARLRPHLDPGNVEKTMTAPVTAIIGYDMAFYDRMDILSANPEARGWFSDKSDAALTEIALRNASLQGAYLIMAARALGLDCGPMSGFSADGVRDEFFAGTAIVPNFLCNLGYGDHAALLPRAGRLEFGDVCTIL